MSNVFIVYRLSEARDSMGNDLPGNYLVYYGRSSEGPFPTSDLTTAYRFDDGLRALKAARWWGEGARVEEIRQHERRMARQRELERQGR